MIRASTVARPCMKSAYFAELCKKVPGRTVIPGTGSSGQDSSQILNWDLAGFWAVPPRFLDGLSCLLPKRGRRPRRVSCSVSPQKNHWASIPLREATCWSPRRDSSRQHAQAPTPKRDAPRGAATAHAWPDRLPGRRALPPLSSLIRGGCHHALVDAIGCSSGAFRSIWGPTCPASTPADSPGRRGGP
jgi:hypothetical protein